MKKKVAVIRAVFCICAAMGWWGFLYPELTLTPDTYEMISEENIACPEEDVIELDSEEDVYRMILRADEGQIRYKSRLLLQLEAMFRKLN